MLRVARRLCLLLLLSLAASVAASSPDAPGQLWLVDQGWRVVGDGKDRVVELNALVVNDGDRPLPYEVMFLMEAGERPPRARLVTVGSASKQPAEAQWQLLHSVSVRGGPLAAGRSEAVRATMPYTLLAATRAYRFRAELVDASGSAKAVPLLSLGSPFATSGPPPAAVPSGTVVAPAASSSPEAVDRALGAANGDDAHGSGTMNGSHTAQRVGDMWIESGSGTINLTTTPPGTMVIYYTYTAQGASAAELVATATTDPSKTSYWYRKNQPPEVVVITSATATMTSAGSRQQAGNVITRTGCSATGTFTGTVGGKPWTGTLTMTNGEQTLDLSTNQGTHSFSIRFTASQ